MRLLAAEIAVSIVAQGARHAGRHARHPGGHRHRADCSRHLHGRSTAMREPHQGGAVFRHIWLDAPGRVSVAQRSHPRLLQAYSASGCTPPRNQPKFRCWFSSPIWVALICRGVINSDDCSTATQDRASITRVGDVCVSPFSINWYSCCLLTSASCFVSLTWWMLQRCRAGQCNGLMTPAVHPPPPVACQPLAVLSLCCGARLQ